jgi:PAS domain S-box-containing protein
MRRSKMKDSAKTKQQLMSELVELRHRIGELEAVEAEHKQAEETLRRCQQESRMIADSVPALVSYVDADGCYCFANKQYEEWFGVRQTEIIGKHYRHVLGESAYEQIKDRVQAALSGHRVSHEYVLPCASGAMRWVIADYVPDIGDHREVKGLFILATDITERKQAEQKVEHLNSVLRAMRNVSQLVTRQKNRGRLLKGICDMLIATRGYYNAWVVLVDKVGRLVTTAEAGLGGDFLPMLEKLKRGEMTACAQKALARPGVVVTEDPTSACVDCPLSAKYGGRGAMTVQLEHGGKLYGLLSLSIPRALIAAEEEQTLFQEVAKDIAFALHGMELEEQRKRAEEALRESEEFSSSLLNSSPNAILVINADTSIRYVNPAFENLTGFAPGELAGRKAPYPWWIDETPHITREGFRKIMAEGLQKVEECFERKNGERFWAEISSTAVRKNGQFRYYLSNWVDITERKRAEEALKASEERYRVLVNNANEAIAVAQDGMVKFVNPKAMEFAGNLREELTSRPFPEFIHPDDRDMVVERHLRRLKGEQLPYVYPFRVVDKEGNTKWVEINAVLIQWEGRPATLNFLSDITERKRAEEALKESEERYRSLFENSIEGVFTVDLGGHYTSGNKAFEELYGHTMEELLGVSYKRIVVPEDIDHIFKEYNRMFRTGEPIRSIIYQIVRRDGQRRFLEGCANVITREGRVVGFQGIHRDITERKKAEEALQESEARYRQLIGLSPDGIAVESGGQIAFINPAGAEILGGANPEQLIGRSVMDFVHPDYHGIVIERMRQVKEEGKAAPANEEKYIRLDGTVIDVEVSASPVVYESQAATQVFVRNITERKKAEERIEASLKEKEVLLKEIHHRVKNNLQVISSLLKLQSRQVGDERYAEMLNESQNRLKTIALIHEKLYQSEDLARIDFAGYIKSLVRGLFSAYRVEAGRIALRTEVENIRLGVDYAMPCGLIINELLSNSLKHAFPQGKRGEIKIAIRPIAENQVEFVVSDNGVGIPENLDFKNTESLGLRLVTLLAEHQLEGEIKLDRTEGTRFQIRFGVAE